jgi:hypothetical protein
MDRKESGTKRKWPSLRQYHVYLERLRKPMKVGELGRHQLLGCSTALFG